MGGIPIKGKFSLHEMNQVLIEGINYCSLLYLRKVPVLRHKGNWQLNPYIKDHIQINT